MENDDEEYVNTSYMDDFSNLGGGTGSESSTTSEEEISRTQPDIQQGRRPPEDTVREEPNIVLESDHNSGDLPSYIFIGDLEEFKLLIATPPEEQGIWPTLESGWEQKEIDELRKIRQTLLMGTGYGTVGIAANLFIGVHKHSHTRDKAGDLFAWTDLAGPLIVFIATLTNFVQAVRLFRIIVQQRNTRVVRQHKKFLEEKKEELLQIPSPDIQVQRYLGLIEEELQVVQTRLNKGITEQQRFAEEEERHIEATIAAIRAEVRGTIDVPNVQIPQ